MKKSLFLLMISVLIISCEGDYHVGYEWVGMTAHKSDNSDVWPVISTADSLPAATFGLKLEMDVEELYIDGRYPDSETPPINENSLDSLIITSSTGFDPEHPAGTNLTDLFIILNDNYLQTLPADGSEGYFITRIYATDFTDQYLVDEIDLLLMKEPDSAGSHKFYITFILQNGVFFTDSTETVFLY